MLVYFAITLFVSAFLLFLVQPMVGKMILPHLGGTPAVWNACMVFFQAVLLLGYTYTHGLTSRCGRRSQLGVQLAVLLLPFVLLLLPFGLGDWKPPAATNPVYDLLWLLLRMVGVPFFVVATSAPLLQKWFAGTGHQAARDPYFLYGASNIGSLLALMLYPLAVEPLFGLEQQAWLWTIGYGLLTILMIGCMGLVWRGEKEPLPPPSPPTAPAPVKSTASPAGKANPKPNAKVPSPSPQPSVAGTVTLGRRLRWLCLSMAPSSLMLGVTTYLTTDIAAIPFFWVIPLGLYLVTFVLVFSRWPTTWTDRPHTVVLYLQPLLLTVLVLITSGGVSMRIGWILFLLHVVVFFLTALVCHGELARDRPGTEHLTEFYLWMSLGGVLGGIFNTLIAPEIFRYSPLEYAGAMIFAYLLRPRLLGKKTLSLDKDDFAAHARRWALDVIVPLLVALWTCGILITAVAVPSFASYFLLVKLLTAVGVMSMFARPVRCGLSLGMFAMVLAEFDRFNERLVFADRGFFGFVRVRVEEDDDRNTYNALIHGRINHGWQSTDPKRRREPLTYFHPKGGIGQVFQKFSWYGYRGEEFAWPDARLPASLVALGTSPLGSTWQMLTATQSEPAYGVVGLGVGALAAHAKPLQFVRFYEIDPLVVHLSVPPRGQPIFTFLEDARERGSDIKVVLGDGRLTLEKDPVQGYYHILLLDAFSSDAIPVHLLSREAMVMYLDKLAEGGLLIFNTSNRHVDISGVLADLAHDLDLSCYSYSDTTDKARFPTKIGTSWVVLQRKNLRVNAPLYNGGAAMPGRMLPAPFAEFSWVETPRLGRRVWTDRYSNVLGILNWR